MKRSVILTTLAISACNADNYKTSASTHVVGGADTERWPAVARVLENRVMPTGEKVKGLCTGTFIAPNMLLTASHCVLSSRDNPGNLEVNGHFVQRLIIGKNFGAFHPQDLALLVFAEPVQTETVPLCQQKPAIGNKVAVVGFGCNEIIYGDDGWAARDSGMGLLCKGAGKKREGSNIISAISSNEYAATGNEVNGFFLRFVGPGYRTTEMILGENVSASAGDSGGPLFLYQNDGSNQSAASETGLTTALSSSSVEKPCLAGIATGGSPGLKQETNGAYSLYINLQAQPAQDFFADAATQLSNRVGSDSLL